MDKVIADNGYYSEAEVRAVEQEDGEGNRQGPKVYCTVGELEKREEGPEPRKGATVKEVMEHRQKSGEGKKIYKKRKETVEPVFGIIKQAMGSRQFLLRGLDHVGIEWKLISLAYNMKRLFSLSGGIGMPFSSATWINRGWKWGIFPGFQPE